ncbi:MAG: glycoside hydrolase family 10 protein [Armatimonadota bacterium]
MNRNAGCSVLAKAARWAAGLLLIAAACLAEEPNVNDFTPRATRPGTAVELTHKPGELRGAWMGYHGEPTWEATMSALRENGFNAVFPWMASPGGAFYPSQVLPVAPAVAEQGDFLAGAVAWGRTCGIEVHARVIALMAYLGPASAKDRYAAEKRYMVDAEGRQVKGWLCPAKPVNRHMLINAVMELARGYDLDGIQFDYLRYPSSKTCYCDSCRYLFQQHVGRKISNWPVEVRAGSLRGQYADWRREQVTSLLAAIVERTRALKPGLTISAAVFVDWTRHRETFGQDTAAWIDRRLVDFVCPMDYAQDEATFSRWVRAQVSRAANAVPVYVGIGPLSDNAPLGPEQVVSQVRLSRELGGDGFVLFKYTEALARDYLPLLRPAAPAVAVVPPTHHGPRVAFELSDAQLLAGQSVYEEGTTIRVTTRVEGETEGGQAVERFGGRLSLYTVEGGLLEHLNVFVAGGTRQIRSRLHLPAGRFRLAVSGEMRLASGEARQFAKWSPVLEVWTREQAQAVRDRYAPPPEGETRVRVMIVAPGRGADPMWRALRASAEWYPFQSSDLSPEALRHADVVILPQLAEGGPTVTAETVAGLRAWVEAGGRMMVTHDGVGFRGYPSICPTVCLEGTGRSATTKCTIAAQHPLAGGLAKGTIFEHTYADHITLRLGSQGQKIIADGDSPAGAPVVACGEVGRGRYIANGMAVGVGPDGSDVDLPPGETNLLYAAVRWLGGE